MEINPDAAFSTGDVMRRLADQDRRIAALETARRLPAASIGSGGLRIQGGRLLAEDSSAERIFEVTTEPAGIFMRDELISDIALLILGETFVSDSVLSLEGTSSTTFTDLATPGPSVDVEVGESGRMVVTVSADIRPPLATTAVVAVTTSAFMSYEITGATIRSADDTDGALGITHKDDFGSGGEGSSDRILASRQSLQTGLNPGTHTVTAKYRRFGATEGVGDAEFVNRVITVQAF